LDLPLQRTSMTCRFAVRWAVVDDARGGLKKLAIGATIAFIRKITGQAAEATTNFDIITV
jgi:hypothetical protein